MIHYQRTAWYGFWYLLKARGSVFPRCVPPCLLSCVMNWLVLAGYLDNSTTGAESWLAHPYTFQLVGIVFGYLMVTRINMSYARYWEGVTMVKNMHSKWADACAQVISFDRAKSTECNVTQDPFCCHMVRLFSQMSAMATMRLHVLEPNKSILFDEVEGRRPERTRLAALGSKTTLRPKREGSRSRVTASAPSAAQSSGALAFDGGRSRTAKITPMEERESHLAASKMGISSQNLNEVAAAADAYKKHQHGNKARTMSRMDKIHELAGGISKSERELLLAAPCPVFASAQRIQRSIITRLHAGGMHAPPPIISRIFQEVSNGLLFYNNATKMKEVPVPFSYVQLNTFLLNVFSLFLCPVAIASFTKVWWLSLVTTFITVGSFYAVYIVANELEDPFGTEENDMPMLEYHEEFCASLCALVTNAWLPEDQWMVASGPWIKPRNVAIAAGAFAKGTRFSTKIAVGRRDESSAARRPYNSLLNRAKVNRARMGYFGQAFTKARDTAVKMPEVVVMHDVSEKATVIQRAVRAKNATRKMGSPTAGRSVSFKREEAAAAVSAPVAAAVAVSAPAASANANGE